MAVGHFALFRMGVKNADYDLAHYFGASGSGGSGGWGACKTGYKHRGNTDRVNPRGDAWDVDYVAHEIGHQFGKCFLFPSDLCAV
eukprot:SAG25_NODE_14340_length_256_cov_0.656051_1_plen_84_part_11